MTLQVVHRQSKAVDAVTKVAKALVARRTEQAPQFPVPFPRCRVVVDMEVITQLISADRTKSCLAIPHAFEDGDGGPVALGSDEKPRFGRLPGGPLTLVSVRFFVVGISAPRPALLWRGSRIRCSVCCVDRVSSLRDAPGFSLLFRDHGRAGFTPLVVMAVALHRSTATLAFDSLVHVGLRASNYRSAGPVCCVTSSRAVLSPG